MNDTTPRRIAMIVAGFVILIIAMNLLASGLDDVVGGSEPGGASGSSYATQESGLAAFTKLLARYDHPVTRIRGDLTDAVLDSDDTVLLINPEVAFSDEEGIVLRDFAERGGHLVLAQVTTAEAQRVLPEGPPRRAGITHYTAFSESLPELRDVETAGTHGFERTSSATPLAFSPRRDVALAQSTDIGAGVVISLADASVFSNDYLGLADNAAFALELVGDGRGVVFAEGVHGYGEQTGLSALPTRWKFSLLGLVFAAIVFAWARGRRLGPPDRPARSLPPARSDYVRALSDTLVRSREPAAALGTLAAWAREITIRRAGLPTDAPRETVNDAARELGLTDDEIYTLWNVPRTDAEMLALGRAVARITDGRITT